MADDKPNADNLTDEKLQLEIEELKIRLADSKKSKTWEGYVKPIIPIAITLIIAIFGSIITGRFNQAQLTITESKNKSDKEIAQINASLSYIKLMTEISDSSLQLRQQAKTVIASALPPEASFNIAINELPNNPDVLKVLIKTYKEESWKYLVPFIEFQPIEDRSEYNSNNLELGHPLADSMFRIIGKLHPLLDKENNEHKYFLLNFLDNNQQLNEFNKYLFSGNYKSKNRVFAFINYLDYVYYNPNVYGNLAKQGKIFEEFKALVINSKDNDLKCDISLAAASTLFDGMSHGWSFIETSAQHFWDDLDISKGEIPVDGSVKKKLLESIFQQDYRHFSVHRIGIDIVRENLLQKLLLLNYSQMDMENMWLILHSYCEKPYGEKDTLAFLLPEQTYQVMKKILTTTYNEEQKRDLALYVGSGSTIMIFEGLSKDKEAGKKYVRLLIDWYFTNRNVTKDYKEIDGFVLQHFQLFCRTYPEFKNEIDTKFK